MVSENDASSVQSEKSGRDLYARLFKERELLLRTDGEVRFLRLSPKLQAGVCASALVFALWTTGASVTSWVQQQDLNEKSEEIVEAKLSYDNLRKEVDRFETRMVGLNNRMLELIGDNGNTSIADLEDEIRQFGGMGTELRLAVKRLSIDLDLPEEEKHRIITSRKTLHDQIRGLEGRLDDANQHVENLQVDIADLNGDMLANNKRKEQLSKERDKLLMSVAKLEGQFDSSKVENSTLSTKIAELNSELLENHSTVIELEQNDSQLRSQLARLDEDLSSLTTEHAETQRRVALAAKRLTNTAEKGELVVASGPKYIVEKNNLERLEDQTMRVVSDLAKARQEKNTMDAAIDTVLGGLERVAGFDRSLQGSEHKDTDQVLSLLDQIEGLHDSQFEMVTRLNAQASANIVQVENIIRTTGIDPERMLEISGLPIGQGGPLVEMDFVSGSAENLETKVAALETKVTRWETLQKIAKCIPMMSPVDYYNLTSKFGKRKDPYTGKSAMHKGIDMGGWPGTNVWATAPGKVTFAGNSGRYGKMVEIDHGCGIKTIYGHLKKVLVKKGQEVEHRFKIGKLGSSGRSTGPHVHFEVRVEGQAVDPMKFIDAGRYVFKS